MWKMLFPAVEKVPEELSSRRAARNIPAPQDVPTRGRGVPPPSGGHAHKGARRPPGNYHKGQEEEGKWTFLMKSTQILN